MPEPPRTVHLDELERVPGPDSLTWLPVRATLGVRAFGTNAYVADQAGDDVVEPHDEDGTLAHEELYFVARGHARFVIDAAALDAPAGTYVFVPDPASHRHAIAVEPGTTVLSFGGPATFTPSAWEWSFRANPLLGTDPERARAILDEGFAVHPDSPSLHYQLACVEALQGRDELALASLARALELEPELREEAAVDDDLAGLRGDRRFRALVDWEKLRPD